MTQAPHTGQMLSIHDLCRQGTGALGPGCRYVIWTQGCPFHCEGCITPESRERNNDKQVRICDLENDIVSRQNIDGITISGGEPFLQAGVLAELLERVLGRRPELTVLSFTGYTLEQLTSPDAQRLLSHLDLLIDGPYVEELNDDIGLRGSSNQRFHYLTPRLLPWKQQIERGPRKTEIHMAENQVFAIGVPAKRMNLSNLLTNN